MSHAFKGERPEANAQALQGTIFQHPRHKREGSAWETPHCKPAEPHVQPVAEILGETLLDERVLHLGSGGNPTRSNLVLVTEKARNAPFDESELKLSGKQLKDLLT